MAVEIERKFLVANDSWKENADRGMNIRQGYFATMPGTTVRIRTAGPTAFLTVKGPSVNLARSEYEYEIPSDDAEAMLSEFCGTRVVDKTRYLVIENGKLWELDVYKGANEGLMTAELEMPAADMPFTAPKWLGKEVSGQMRYSNGELAKCPYKEWKDQQ